MKKLTLSLKKGLIGVIGGVLLGMSAQQATAERVVYYGHPYYHYGYSYHTRYYYPHYRYYPVRYYYHPVRYYYPRHYYHRYYYRW